jgi:uncharacterized Zn-binding protein involved in type VI secretion
MPAAARVNDPIGHAPGVSTGNIPPPGVPTVLIEGQAAAVQGPPVTCSRPRGNSTDGQQSFATSSKTVYIGGAPALRVNDSTTTPPCGATIIAGAQRVVIGG